MIYLFDMKILNLYAGIGGNRKLWGNDHEITSDGVNWQSLNEGPI